MDALLYLAGRSLVTLIALLPLRIVARLGRLGGAAAYLLDARHRRVAQANLTRVFAPGMSPAEIRAVARENFRRIGENFACGVKTACMSPAALRPHFEFVGADRIQPFDPSAATQSRIVAIGHFGNFELYARFGQFVPGFRCAATYRGLRQPALDRLLRSLRERSGCLFFDRRGGADALKTALAGPGLLLGLLADQHAGDRGLRLPFLGHDCSTSAAPALLALRYRCPLHTAICYRVGLARWRIEVGPEIPTRHGDEPRPVEAITAEINHAFEEAVRRDPANWFWVHNRWKPSRRAARPNPAAVAA